jgi:hypothetical protein
MGPGLPPDKSRGLTSTGKKKRVFQGMGWA